MYGLSFISLAALGRPGKVFFVSNVTTNDNINYIQNAIKPDSDSVIRFHTSIASALLEAQANRGDTFYLLPGHTETISNATALAMTVAGVSVVALGSGANRATITLDSAATAKITVTAANISFENCIFIANFADIATVFLLSTAPGFSIKNCEFRDTSNVLNFLAIVTTTVSVNSDGLVFNGNRLSILGTTAATTPIKVANTLDRITINDNFIVKAVLNNTSCVLAHGALVVTNLEMSRNKLFSANTDSATGGFLITTSSTTNTGMVCDNYVNGLDVAAAILVTAGCKYGMFNNLYDGDVDASGFVLPAIGTN